MIKTVNDIISECGKLFKKEYMTRHDWGGEADPPWTVQDILTIRTNDK